MPDLGLFERWAEGLSVRFRRRWMWRKDEAVLTSSRSQRVWIARVLRCDEQEIVDVVEVDRETGAPL